jgi:hypothetical protein
MNLKNRIFKGRNGSPKTSRMNKNTKSQRKIKPEDIPELESIQIFNSLQRWLMPFALVMVFQKLLNCLVMPA